VNAGILYLVPASLGPGDITWAIPPAVRQCIAGLGHFIVEHPKTARQFLKQIGCVLPIQSIKMEILDEHTRVNELEGLLAPALTGNDIGLLSEAGCPAIADPGAGLVRLAHQKNIRVMPLVGPSSILLALIASGLNGQKFVFHGYLPVDPDRRAKKLVQLEKDSITHDQTQIFIETPYRNQKMLESIVLACLGSTVVCVASDLTLPREFISTRTVKEWKRALPDINNRPAVFLLHG
jgi:16S rRNA (cytidine1402-2'-O)-methyltransferase